MTELVYINGELFHAEDLSEDTLAHYGVPGTKWGKRRAAKKGVEYNYKSLQTRSAERGVKKASKKGDAAALSYAKKKAQINRDLDGKIQNSLENRSKNRGRVKAGLNTAAGLAAAKAVSPLGARAMVQPAAVAAAAAKIAGDRYENNRAIGKGRVKSLLGSKTVMRNNIVKRELGRG